CEPTGGDAHLTVELHFSTPVASRWSSRPGGSARGGVRVVPALAVRAGSGRLDGPQAHPEVRRGFGERVVDTHLIEVALGERRFRPRAVRIDSTAIEADVRYPIDAGLAWH